MSTTFYETIEETNLIPARFELVHSGDYIFPAHWHEYLEILYMKSGTLSAVISAKEYDLRENQIMIINSRDLHMTKTKGCIYLLLQISAEQLKSFFPNFNQLRFQTIINSDSAAGKKLGDLLCELEEIWSVQMDGYPLLFTSRLYEFLFHLYRTCSFWSEQPNPSQNARDALRITNIMEWVKEHYRESITLDDAASYLALSREYFCRLFKRYTGQTFLEYVNDVRVIHLHEDLLNSDETITVLMEKHGISNYRVFLRTFKRLYGCSPQKLRKKTP
ncbi:MAG: AraC family transcriptional regulator [Fusicatenibacter sp.]|nr:AraC family transcriptional regulator [Lachnospiraceae bacterium]MDY2937701.1 AraC family transcriptional regulator [Fusicatenibacter sp.]